MLGFIGEKLGQGAGFIASQFSGGEDMSGIDTILAAPDTPTFSAPVGGTSKSVSVGPTTINIDATNMTPEQLRPAVEQAVDSRLGDHLRAED